MITARPVVTARIAFAASTVVLAVFVVIALVMKRHNAGAHFGDRDQIGTIVLGALLAGLLLIPTRPRLAADAEALRLRGYLGGWRVVPWDVVVRVEFPRTVRFARIVLPGEETLAIYAVQRLDTQRSVEVMRRLREQFAATHPAA